MIVSRKREIVPQNTFSSGSNLAREHFLFSRISVKHLSIVWFPWRPAVSGHESLKLQTGTEDPFVHLIDELHVISENERTQTA